MIGVRWPSHRARVGIADGEGIRKGIMVRKVLAGVIRPSRYTLVRHPLIVGARIPGGMRVVPAMGRARQKLTWPHCRPDETAGDNRSCWVDATAAPPLIPRNPSIAGMCDDQNRACQSLPLQNTCLLKCIALTAVAQGLRVPNEHKKLTKCARAVLHPTA